MTDAVLSVELSTFLIILCNLYNGILQPLYRPNLRRIFILAGRFDDNNCIVVYIKIFVYIGSNFKRQNIILKQKQQHFFYLRRITFSFKFIDIVVPLANKIKCLICRFSSYLLMYKLSTHSKFNDSILNEWNMKILTL